MAFVIIDTNKMVEKNGIRKESNLAPKTYTAKEIIKTNNIGNVASLLFLYILPC